MAAELSHLLRLRPVSTSVKDDHVARPSRMFRAEERPQGDPKFRARSLGEIYSSAVDMFRPTVAPSTGFDYLEYGDDIGGPNLHRQPPRKAIFNKTALIIAHPKLSSSLKRAIARRCRAGRGATPATVAIHLAATLLQVLCAVAVPRTSYIRSAVVAREPLNFDRHEVEMSDRNFRRH
jgi:hypothetical protein